MKWQYLHPGYKIAIGLCVLFFATVVAGGQVLIAQRSAIRSNQSFLNSIRQQQERGEERAYANRAVSGCFDIINDQEIEITEECTDERVVVYYPPSICRKLPNPIPNCGEKAKLVTKD